VGLEGSGTPQNKGTAHGLACAKDETNGAKGKNLTYKIDQVPESEFVSFWI
jgi:hypothetical protein